MAMAFPNIYHHRKVADTSAKGCELCYKPSTSVLVTPENKDFFYVCVGHLKEKGFCSPIIDHEAIAAKKKEMDEEIERVKKEYEDKQRKKNEKQAEKENDKKDGKDKDGEIDTQKEEKTEKKDESKPENEDKGDVKSPPKAEDEPRVFALQRTFYQQRVDRKRQAEMARRNRERLSNPNFFPSVPKDQP
ncbi:Uu.00g073160.m01.CDS01 [Anthostomella pinea]|uniref:Uu.00g073160.m01.CDS01 n=1 Tax=Anthostomella pinea TaxID=933095 RepID=A0AAI8YP17_9PEZI|nr:Uu.00g073160.m01.CDS01 [Anthostomella pinea]